MESAPCARPQNSGDGQRVVLFPLDFGYGWQTLISDSTLAGVFRTTPLTPAWSLQALWTLLIIAATVLSGNAQETPFKSAQNDEIPCDFGLKTSVFIVPRGLALAIATYFACCWLGAESGVGALFLRRFAPTLLTALAFWLADFAAGAFLLALPEAQRGVWRALRFLWFYGLLFSALAYIVAGAFKGVPFSLPKRLTFCCRRLSLFWRYCATS